MNTGISTFSNFDFLKFKRVREYRRLLIVIVLLYIEQKKKCKSCFCSFSNGKQLKARERNVITRDLECP